jgi:membrane-associated PAP2 superfamily phosphatase
MPLKKLRKPSPENVKPKDTPDDYTGPAASNRVLWINLWFLKYGTNDKFQGAAIFFALIVVVLIAVSLLIGCFCPEKQIWLDKHMSWLQWIFTFTIGIAIGKSINNVSTVDE